MDPEHVDLAAVVQDLLRDSEEVKVAIYARALQYDTSASTSPNGPDMQSNTSVWENATEERVLSVVTHLDYASGEEQGCIFVLKPTSNRPNLALDVYSIEHVLPIIGRFSISVAQPHRATIDLSKTGSLSSISILNQSKAELTVTIHPGHDFTLEPIYLLTRDTHGLRSVLAECKRFKELTEVNYEAGVTPPYTWIIPYVSNSLPEILSPIPPDLRHLHRSPYSFLSPATAGQPGDEALDISLIREDWIKHKVYSEIFDPSPRSPLRIRIGTFNVNGKLPSQDLSPWVRGGSAPCHLIPPLKEISPFSMGESSSGRAGNVSTTTLQASKSEIITDDNSTASFSQSSSSTLQTTTTSSNSDPNDPDMIVLAFQELDLSTEALLYSTRTTREDAWCSAALAGLGEKAIRYQKLISKQLVGMLIVIIVKKELVTCFSEMKATSVGAGILGLMGNKGATAIRIAFTPLPTSLSAQQPHSEPVHSVVRPAILTFVNSHLAAFDEMYDRRNADFHDLSKRLSFDSGIPVQHSATEMDGYQPLTIPLSVYQSDALFWMVDLNYRINLSDGDVRILLADEPERESLSLLQQYDQLKLAIRTKKAFQGFAERKITHPPSYRFGTGIPTDSLGYDMKRKPAWTDRVLHMSSPVIQVEQISYTSHPEITMSDHRPVSADFVLNVPIVSLEKLDALVRSLWRDVMDIENSEETPRLKPSFTSLDFGKIFYKRTSIQSLELENVGKVPCACRFVPMVDSASVHPSWLKIEPMSGLIRPREKLQIRLSAEVDNAIAQQLNAGSARLDDTLILHTSLGKDHFISVTGQYQRTCFATSLTRLTRLSGPVRHSQRDSGLLGAEAAMNAPQEIMRLVNWLMSNATEVKNLFLTPGDPDLVTDIRERLDTGLELAQPSADDGEGLALTVATCLLELLESLPEPVIPTELQSKCAHVTNRDEAFALLDGVPSASVNVWISVTAFLHFISQQNNPGHAERLGDILAPILLRDDVTAMPAVSPVSKRKFLTFFITST